MPSGVLCMPATILHAPIVVPPVVMPAPVIVAAVFHVLAHAVEMPSAGIVHALAAGVIGAAVPGGVFVTPPAILVAAVVPVVFPFAFGALLDLFGLGFGQHLKVGAQFLDLALQRLHSSCDLFAFLLVLLGSLGQMHVHVLVLALFALFGFLLDLLQLSRITRGKCSPNQVL
jgi:hypothetical protein